VFFILSTALTARQVNKEVSFMTLPPITPPTPPSHAAPIPRPVSRRLCGYSFDPSISIKLETMSISEIVYKVPWEVNLEKGPVGEYLEVVDYDPPSQAFYAPVDLSDPFLIAQDGLAPSAGNPQFHQQMVYAVAMTTINNFEQALGRKVQWRPTWRQVKNEWKETYLPRLRIYPHALREANAFYNPQKRALMFGYFSATGINPGTHLAGGTVFACLSHDIIAHETTHAILDGIQRRFMENTHPDALAFHEAFADIVALFQHFSFPEVLRQQIAKTRGDLASQNLLGQLAQEFGVAIGNYGSLRDALGQVNPVTQKWEPLVPDPKDYQNITEPHARGSILVAAVFDAFTSIYKHRTQDLMRIASGGTGVLPSGALHPDLVNRLAREAAAAARQVLLMCIRALDYCPPVALTFGDYLRALVTADTDLVPDDDLGYRVAFIEAFQRRGIYPRDVRNLSVESLVWRPPLNIETQYFTRFAQKLNFIPDRSRLFSDRQVTFTEMAHYRAVLHNFIKDHVEDKHAFEKLTGIVLSPDSWPADMPPLHENQVAFEVSSLFPAQRIGPDGDQLNQMFFSITQKINVPLDPADPNCDTFPFRGGCTLVIDLNTQKLLYRIAKPIGDPIRLQQEMSYIKESGSGSLRATYFSHFKQEVEKEPFAQLHRGD
jgi:hypothetical protein